MHVVIVGNGIAGVTAARHVRKGRPDAHVTLVSDEGLVPFARTALMYVYMGVLTEAHAHLYAERFWDENRIDRVLDRAETLDTDRQRVVLRDGGPLDYDRLLVATGSVPALPPWPGVTLGGVQGLYHAADLDRMERDTRGVREAAVVGGGLIGVELAEMLRVRGVAVTFLVREASYLPRVLSAAEGALVADEVRRHGVDLRLGAEVARLEGDAGGDGAGRVRAVVTTAGDRVPARFVGVGTGVRPNVGWLDGSGVEVATGVLVDEALQTSAENVWAAGDCAELRRPPPGARAREPIWYAARLQGATAALGMVGRPRRYRPGVFFNSAKFFDLEYQVYGATALPAPAGQADWAWTDGRRSLRVRHRTDGPDQAVLGVSALGVRLRQDVCTTWIREGRGLDAALSDLRAARFDAELSAWGVG
jgi:NADPH-dependent 2,4-dienoyl-CoA reductase/sulfur reductase-like enzyme